MKRAKDYLSKEELSSFTRASDAMGLLALLVDWGIIAATFAVMARWPNPLTIALGVVVLGGRQLALAVLTHEASHRSLCRTRWLNDFVGRWLAGAPIWADMDRYRIHHLAHHSYTGTERDPDMCLVAPFPVSRTSFARKLWRDLNGRTGLRRMIGLFAMDFGFITYSASGDTRRIVDPEPFWPRVRLGFRRFFPVGLTNIALGLTLAAFGHGWLYAIWVLAWLTTYSLFMRLRSIAEHACTETSPDPFLNTRTVLAGPLAALTVAPHGVNYHLEHHLVMTAPYFRLPALHRRLKEVGALEDSPVERGYPAVWRRAIKI
ncbi:MAG: fatty acid desaturase family protein [Myxococcota bacterium]